MVLSIIIGTIIWLALIWFLSKYIEIFATPWAWIVSWFVVVAIVFNIGGAISDSKEQKALTEEASKINGAWQSSDEKIGIRALSDSGDVKRYNDSGVQGFMAAVYKEDGTSDLMLIFNPDDHTVFAQHLEGEQETENGTYKLKGWFSKKLVIDLESSGKTTYKRKSKDWDYYMD